MFTLPGYVINEQIHEGSRTKVFRGYTLDEGIPVVLKVLFRDAADSEKTSRFFREYEITRSLNIEGIVRPEKLEQTDSVIALVSKDFGAISLKEYIKNHRIGIDEFLEIAVQLSETLSMLHNRGIIHGDIKPGNVLIEPASKKVYIIDFSSAVSLFSKNYESVFFHSERTYEYMAPEVTGLLNIGIDFRSDLYSLGVMFYELITGVTPFRAETQEEWLQVHMVQAAKPLHEIVPDIPQIISDIIMKLLSKSPAERYQTAAGLAYDLKECRNRFAGTGEIKPFTLGLRDRPGCFILPQKLAGREKERRFLADALNRVASGKSETILVCGDPGIGKTMLIDESMRTVAGEGGFYVSGKFDQLKSSIPYAPFASAFANLIRQLMTKSEKELNEWKKAIHSAFGKRAAVIAQVIPELQWITGERQPVDELPPKEAQNRFLMVFRDFVKVFARANHPLVIFIDDLQWDDYSSINLFKYLSQDADLRHILFIGAFRDNELSEDHPLTELLDRAKAGELDGRCTILHLNPLHRMDFADILSECLHTGERNICFLSEVLYRKTGGNPLFFVQLLTHVYEEGMVYFEQNELKLDIDAINSLEPVEDVLDLLLKKLERLPEETREILKIASCIGNRFDIYSVSQICSRTREETLFHLMPALIERLVVPYRTVDDYGNSENEPCEFEFFHDRVQQAVYSPIPEQEKKERHLAIGKFFLKQSDNIEEKIMIIMDHFNRSIDLISDDSERVKMAGYNLIAGRRAKISAAYSSALQYFRAGKAFLSGDSWERNYSLSRDLYLELAQSEYLSANTDTAEKLFSIVSDKTKTELERATVSGLRVSLFASLGKYTESIFTGIRSLRKLGVKIPIRPTKLDYLKELIKYRLLMLNRKIEDLEYLPEMKKPEKIMVAELLSRMASVSITTAPDLHSLLILKAGNYAIMNGNSEMTCIGYIGYGITEGSVFGNYKTGEKYARVSLNLVEKYGKSSPKCIIYFVVGSLMHHWTRPAEEGLLYLRKAEKSAVEAGDLLIIGYSNCFILENKFIMGRKLSEVLDDVRRMREIAVRHKHDTLLINVEIYSNTVQAIMGITGGKTDGLARQLDKKYLVEMVRKDQSSLATWRIRRMHMYFLSGDYLSALKEAEEIRLLMGAIQGFLLQSEYVFYYSVSTTAIYDSLTSAERRHYGRVLAKNRKVLKKWAESCKENFECMYLIVLAEIARTGKKKERCMYLYDKAVHSARQNGRINYEAIACELAAKFYLSVDLKKIAKAYMTDACNCYRIWGAYAKLRQLKDKYPELTEDVVVFGNLKTDENTVYPKVQRPDRETSESSGTAGSLDLGYIDRIVESIYSEPDINELLNRFIDVAIKAIGATRGYLILEKNGEMYIESGKDNVSGKTVTESIHLEKYPDISKSVVRYVARTQETVVLNCDEQPGIFAADPYIAELNPRSIACLPVLFQGIALGVLYFENNFIAGAFASKRIERLKVLSSQVACAKKFQSYLEKDYDKNRSVLVEPLTEREMEVLRLITSGMSNKEIADRLVITVNTVKTYIKNIYEKLGVNRRVQVISRAKELNLL